MNMLCVGAHISDNELREILVSAYEHIRMGGSVVIFEQTAPYSYGGKNFIRRTNAQYIDILRTVGFEIVNSSIVDFKLHRIVLEKNIVKRIVRNKENTDEIRLSLNKKWWYRRLSELLVFLSPNYVKSGIDNVGNAINRWGYALIECRKVDFE